MQAGRRYDETRRTGALALGRIEQARIEAEKANDAEAAPC
jgi:hypothetical protein